MTIDEFAALTKKVIAKDPSGLDGYRPTAIYPARKHIAALQGPPQVALPADQLETLVMIWAERGRKPGEDFLVAFRAAPGKLKVIGVTDGKREQALFDV